MENEYVCAFASVGLAFSTYSRPVPIRYVLVPCNVIGVGLQPSMRMMRLDSLVTAGMTAAANAALDAMATGTAVMSWGAHGAHKVQLIGPMRTKLRGTNERCARHFVGARLMFANREHAHTHTQTLRHVRG